MSAVWSSARLQTVVLAICLLANQRQTGCPAKFSKKLNVSVLCEAFWRQLHFTKVQFNNAWNIANMEQNWQAALMHWFSPNISFSKQLCKSILHVNWDMSHCMFIVNDFKWRCGPSAQLFWFCHWNTCEFILMFQRKLVTNQTHPLWFHVQCTVAATQNSDWIACQQQTIVLIKGGSLLWENTWSWHAQNVFWNEQRHWILTFVNVGGKSTWRLESVQTVLPPPVSLVAFSFKECLFSFISIPSGPNFPVPCSLRKTCEHDSEHFPPCPAPEEAWTILNNFEHSWKKNHRHCWSNCKVISKLCKWFDCLDWMRPPDLATSWCQRERRFSSRVSHVLGEVTSQQRRVCVCLCLFVLLATSLQTENNSLRKFCVACQLCSVCESTWKSKSLASFSFSFNFLQIWCSFWHFPIEVTVVFKVVG